MLSKRYARLSSVSITFPEGTEEAGGFLWFLKEDRRIFGINIYFWCVLFLFLDFGRSTFSALTNLSGHLVNVDSGESDDEAWCYYYKMEQSSFAIEFSHLITILFALAILFDRSKHYLIPYLIAKSLFLFFYAYLLMLYNSDMEGCMSEFFWTVFNLVYSLVTYICVALSFAAFYENFEEASKPNPTEPIEVML
ncbi:unnamed protein product, partial [Mesorhabditis spiculigera]